MSSSLLARVFIAVTVSTVVPALAGCGGAEFKLGSSSGSTSSAGSSGASSAGSSSASGSSSAGSTGSGTSSGASSSGMAASGTSDSGTSDSGASSSGMTTSGAMSSGASTSGMSTTGSASTGSAGSGSATSGASSGTTGGHPPDTCTSAKDCPNGTCWLQLDGAKACVAPVATPPLSMCLGGSTTMCCSKDADCAETGKTDPRCLPLFDVEENFCGGAIPEGNVCRYDQCAADADCKAQAPMGATVATCLPSGAFSRYTSACVYGGCRTDADCTKHPGGQCQYGLAATNGVCSLTDVLFCAYPSDPCQTGTNGTTGCMNGMICVPNADYQGRECGKPPPAYP